ncbi:MAG: DAK2 domain-containing protein [Clostridiales bacterium]|nr:DAK2 domain-containing protein [Clostridiales bacterium]
MISVASAYLEKNKKAIDALNVFPVPDGDTGVNMSLTMQTAAREARTCTEESISAVANAISMGSLKGARGNSGVILSQIFRGFARGIGSGVNEMDGVTLAKAMRGGVEAAYKAVMKPKEGTVLTVVRSMAEAAEAVSSKNNSVMAVIDGMIREGEATLAKTPDMLPVLKEAGVVDAGGMGLVVIIKGFKMALEGVEVPEEEIEVVGANLVVEELNEDIEFGYCTEFFVKQPKGDLDDDDIDTLRGQLEKLGDCVLVVGGGDLLKVHVHTNDPGLALQNGLKMGYLSAIKIENMREQNANLSERPSWEGEEAKAPVEKKPFAMISVSAGEGFSAVFADLGVDHVVSGGQSMNPSIEDILTAIEEVPSDNVFVFPNNKNIIMAAQQAADASSKNVAVIATRSLPQGISGALAFNPEASFEENLEAMNTAIGEVDCGQITHAVRSSNMNGLHVEEGDLIGLFNGDMIIKGTEMVDTCIDLLSKIVSEDREVISVFYGEGVEEAEANALSEALEEAFEECEVLTYNGGQPVYDYIFSVE